MRALGIVVMEPAGDRFTGMTPYSTEKTYGKQALAMAHLQGGQAGWANIGSLGSCGVMGAWLGYKLSSPLFDNGSFPCSGYPPSGRPNPPKACQQSNDNR